MPVGVKVVLPKAIAGEPKAMARAIENVMNGAARAAQADFASTTETWRTKVAFTVQRDGPYRRIVGTSHQIYLYVNNGTRAHVIMPRRKRLRFPARYRAKTTPRRIQSRTGGASGPLVFARQVRHPGTAARQFDQAIADKWGEQLPVLLQRAIDSEVR